MLMLKGQGLRVQLVLQAPLGQLVGRLDRQVLLEQQVQRVLRGQRDLQVQLVQIAQFQAQLVPLEQQALLVQLVQLDAMVLTELTVP